MTKTALIVEPEFMRDHVGVRSYIYSLRELLCGRSQVDLVSYYKSASGTRHWYRLHPKSSSFIRDNGKCLETCYEGSPREVLSGYWQNRQTPEPVTLDDFHFSHIGSDLATERYDLGIITTPWCVTFEDRLPCERMAGIVYDLVPNQYSLSKANVGIQIFASRHSIGFQYYRRHCDFVLAISEDAAHCYDELYGRGSISVVGLPPLIPSHYFHTQPCSESRPANVALAAPFDARKGLAEIPAVINGAAGEIEQLLIYGGLRCSAAELEKFFTDLQVSRVSWWPSATSARVCEIFNNSRALLFPSHHEGLGLPILEAQFYGCRALVRDRSPMNTLVGPGGQFVGVEASADATSLVRCLSGSFDYRELQEWAVERFSPEHVADAIADAAELPHLASKYAGSAAFAA